MILRLLCIWLVLYSFLSIYLSAFHISTFFDSEGIIIKLLTQKSQEFLNVETFF
jgi:hypothetical protein